MACLLLSHRGSGAEPDTLISAFVSRFCGAKRQETTEGSYMGRAGSGWWCSAAFAEPQRPPIGPRYAAQPAGARETCHDKKQQQGGSAPHRLGKA